MNYLTNDNKNKSRLTFVILYYKQIKNQQKIKIGRKKDFNWIYVSRETSRLNDFGFKSAKIV